MNANMRKWFGLFVAVLLYYFIHEGAHLLLALAFGVFHEIRFLQLGVQVAITGREQLTDLQFALFNVAGAASSLLAAYLLTFSARRICMSSSKLLKAVCYYVTLALLFTDPIYLSVLCGFFGGGDMNGIILFGIPEWGARLMFGLIGLADLFLFFKYVYPVYQASFRAAGEQLPPPQSVFSNF